MYCNAILHCYTILLYYTAILQCSIVMLYCICTIHDNEFRDTSGKFSQLYLSLMKCIFKSFCNINISTIYIYQYTYISICVYFLHFTEIININIAAQTSQHSHSMFFSTCPDNHPQTTIHLIGTSKSSFSLFSFSSCLPTNNSPPLITINSSWINKLYFVATKQLYILTGMESFAKEPEFWNLLRELKSTPVLCY